MHEKNVNRPPKTLKRIVSFAYLILFIREQSSTFRIRPYEWCSAPLVPDIFMPLFETYAPVFTAVLLFI